MKTNIKQWLFIKVKLTEFTFKTGNRRGCNNVIRSKFQILMTRLAKKWPSLLEETWCLLSFMLLPPSMRYLRALKQGITINTNHVIAHDQIRFDTPTIQTIQDMFQNCTSSQNGLKLSVSSLTPSYWVFLRRRLCLMCHCYTQFDPVSFS